MGQIYGLAEAIATIFLELSKYRHNALILLEFPVRDGGWIQA
jgi:hypothetical protein